MRNLTFNFVGLAAATLLAFFGIQSAQAADSLEGLFKETGWDKVIGTWVAENGTETSFAWKGADLHSVTKMGDTERNTTLRMADGKVSVTSSDNKGGGSAGTAEFVAGKAVFKITTAPVEGEKKDLTINYTLDGDSLTVQMEGQPTGSTLKRK